MEEKKSKKIETRIGYVAADARKKVFDSGKKVTNITILTGTGEDKRATYVRGWNAMADHLEKIRTGEKWEFKGEVSLEKNEEGKSFETLTARESYPHIKMELQGEVKHVEDKKLTNKNVRNIMLVSSEMEGGREVSKVYNIELYGDKNIARGKDIQVGHTVSAKGHVRMYDYMKGEEHKTIRSFQNPYELTNLSKEQLKGKEANVEKGSSAKHKSKDKGLSV